MTSSWTIPVITWVCLLLHVWLVNSFGADNLRIALDRFEVICPADPSCIQKFDPQLPIQGQIRVPVPVLGSASTATATTATGIWAAVYRSNQNQPSVFVRDEFFHAMKEATTTFSEPVKRNANTWADQLQTPMAQQAPVAVAQLRPSEDFENTWILDSLRCALKKEDMDETCDGGSEFLEALSVGIDSLLLYHLQHLQQRQQQQSSTAVFEGSIRTKATLFSHRLLEDRGFLPVETLSKDMATHVSTLDCCLQKYAQRSVDTRLNPGARDRALQIVAWLGRMDQPEITCNNKDVNDNNNNNNNSGDETDPWANIKMQI